MGTACGEQHVVACPCGSTPLHCSGSRLHATPAGQLSICLTLPLLLSDACLILHLPLGLQYTYESPPPSWWALRDLGKPNATCELGVVLNALWHSCRQCNCLTGSRICPALGFPLVLCHTVVSPLFPPMPTPVPAAKGGARRADYLPMAQEVWWRKDDDGVRSGERGLGAWLGWLW